jgi:hypothetical protein
MELGPIIFLNHLMNSRGSYGEELIIGAILNRVVTHSKIGPKSGSTVLEHG